MANAKKSAQKNTKTGARKDETYWKVLEQAIRLDVQLGHLKWTVTRLSRASGVSRPLIYYYFGKSKLALIEEACRIFAEVLAGTTREKVDNWERGDLAASFIDSRRVLTKTPSAIPFYYMNRERPDSIGKMLRAAEDDYRAKVTRFFPGLSPEQAKSLCAFSLGLAFSPNLTDVEVRVASAMMRALMPGP